MEVSRPILDTLDAFGPHAHNLVSLDTLYATAVAQVPELARGELTRAYCSTTSYRNRFQDIANRFKDAVSGTKVSKTEPEQTIWIPMTELHCPAAIGCTAKWTRAASSERDANVGIRIAGLGSELSFSRKFGFNRSTTTPVCARIELAAKGVLEHCTRSDGSRFTRIRITAIQDTERRTPLGDEADGCQHLPADREAPWASSREEFNLIAGMTEDRGLDVEAGHAADFDFKVDVGLFSFNPKASVKLLRSTTYDYHFDGARTFTGYLPKGRLSHLWATST
ncbi:MAG: hypothetical protein V4510_10445 [bacterium]